MVEFKAEILSPRRVLVGRNAKGAPIFRQFTEADCHRYAAIGNEMVNVLNVPASWNHRDDATPISRDDKASQQAKGFAGKVTSYEIADGKLFARLSIDDADANQVEKVRFVSPEINNFIDGSGKQWGECITHVAITPRPVQHWQQPIQRLGHPIRLAFDSEKGTEMAEPADDKTTDGGGDYFKKAIEALAGKSIILPEDTTPENMCERIVIACMQGEVVDDEDDDPPVDIVPDDQKPPISLSLQKQEQQARDLASANLGRRINSLLKTGRITPPIKAKLLADLGKIQFGFDDKGELVSNNVVAKVEAYEALPKNSAWSKGGKDKGIRLSADDVEEVERPNWATDHDADLTDEQAKARGDAIDKQTGRVARVK